MGCLASFQRRVSSSSGSEDISAPRAAQAFRANPAFRAEDAIMELGVGEALTSFLDEQGVPTIVQRTKIVCPQSLMGAPEPMARMKAMLHDGMEKYDDAADNLSAYEVLTEQADAAALEKQREEDRLAQERLAAEQEKQRAKEEAAEEAQPVAAIEEAAEEDPAPQKKKVTRRVTTKA